jgi:hypothetical protein
VTTSILKAEELKRFLPVDLAQDLPDANSSETEEPTKPLSGRELIARIESLFTSEEAESLARRIEEGRAQMND